LDNNNLVKSVGFDDSFVNGSGKLVTFDKLGKRAAKQEILKAAIKLQVESLQAFENINKSVEMRKKINKAIKSSELGAKRDQCNAKVIDSKRTITMNRKKLEGIAETAAILGIDISKDIDKLQLVEAE
jgi:hypothetical protein